MNSYSRNICDNSNNHSDYKEILFWKIVRNHRLFKFILSKNQYHMSWNRKVVWESIISVDSMLNHGLVGLLKRKVRIGDYIVLSNWSKLFQWFKNDKQFFKDLIRNYPQYINEMFHQLIIRKAIIEGCIGFFSALLDIYQHKERFNYFSSSSSIPFKIEPDSIYLAIQYSRLEILKLLLSLYQQNIEKEDQLSKDIVWDSLFLNKHLDTLDVLEYFICNNSRDNIQLLNIELFLKLTYKDLIKNYLITILVNQSIKIITLNHLIIILKIIYHFEIINQIDNYSLHILESLHKDISTQKQKELPLLNPANFKDQKKRKIIKELVLIIRQVDGLNNFLGEKINFSTLDYSEGDLFELFYQDCEDIENIDKKIDLELLKRLKLNKLVPFYAPYKFASFKLYEQLLKQEKSSNNVNQYLINLFEYCQDGNRQAEFLNSLIGSLKSNKSTQVLSPLGLLFYLIKYDNLQLLQQFSEILLDLVININANGKDSFILESMVQDFPNCIQSTKVLEFFFNNIQFKQFFIYRYKLDYSSPIQCLNFKNQILNEYFLFLKSLEIKQLNVNIKVINFNGLVIKADFDEEFNVEEYLKNSLSNHDSNDSGNSISNNCNFESSSLQNYDYRYRFSLCKGCLSEFQISNSYNNYSIDQIIKEKIFRFHKIKRLVRGHVLRGHYESILGFVQVLMANINSEISNKSFYYSTLLNIIEILVSLGSIKTLEILLSVYPNLLSEAIFIQNQQNQHQKGFFQQVDLSNLLIKSVENNNLIMLQYLLKYIKVSIDFKDKSSKSYLFLNHSNSLEIENLAYIYLKNEINQLKK